MDLQTKVVAAAKPRVVSVINIVINMVSKRCSAPRQRFSTDSAPRQDHGIGATVI
eukprot:SAG11_NODE_13067_length_671_cov_5.000000_1_plen_55_part_00